MDDLIKLPTIGWVRDHWLDFSSSLPFVDTLLYFDIDTLFCINGLFGREETDRKLANVATTIRSSVPAPYPVARFAGDEFMALVERKEFSDEKLRSLLQALNEPEYEIKVDYSNIDHFSVSCCMLTIGALGSFKALGTLTDLAIEAIRNTKSHIEGRKYRYQGVLAIDNAT